MAADGLGSTRAVVDSAGNVKKRYDYLPFGEELYAGVGGRTTATGYQSQEGALGEKFTGKERDAETGLDWFNVRYFSGAQGRFTSPDDPLTGRDRNNPQSWNLYSYSLNNPLRLIDPTGHEPEEAGCGQNLKDCGPTIGPLPQTTNLGQTRDRAIGGFKGLLSAGLSLLEFVTPGANHDTIEDLKSKLGPSSQNQQFGAEVAGIVGMLLPGGQAEGVSASSTKAGLNLKKALASEQQMGEILSGAGTVIAGPGGRVALRDAPRLAAEYGGKAEEWVRIGSSNFKAADGVSFEVHAYKNITTGKIVEFKTKFQ